MKTNARLLPLLGAVLITAAACREGAEVPPQSTPATAAADFGYVTGLESAPVTVIEYSDFGCPYCAQFALRTYPELHTEFVLSGQVRWIYVPFVIGRFPNGGSAALAGECAGEQGRFWSMHDLLFAHQAEWRREAPADELFAQLADSAGADVPRFQECYRENRPAERIRMHNDLARGAQVRGTPSFRIDGRVVEGALPIEQFRNVLQYAVLSSGQR
ncbi:MAG: thioredoxin domain-containing protein [Gemmatimonadota bacterium]